MSIHKSIRDLSAQYALHQNAKSEVALSFYQLAAADSVFFYTNV